MLAGLCFAVIGSNFAGIYNAQQAALEEEMKRERGAERRLAHSLSGSQLIAPVNSPAEGAPSSGRASTLSRSSSSPSGQDVDEDDDSAAVRESMASRSISESGPRRGTTYW